MKETANFFTDAEHAKSFLQMFFPKKEALAEASFSIFG